MAIILAAAAGNLASAGEMKVTVVQPAGDYGLHTREDAITWASVGWAGRSLRGTPGGLLGKIVKIFDTSSPKPSLMGRFEILKKNELRELGT